MKVKLKDLQKLYDDEKADHKSVEKSSRRTSKAKDSELEKIKKLLANSQNECNRYRIHSSTI